MKTMIKGTSVQIEVRKAVGNDEFDRPVYNSDFETVSNVLIGEPSSEDVINELNLSGKRIAYTLAIPKGDGHDWENAVVIFFGQKFRTIGTPVQGIDENIPLDWNKKVRVERYVTED